MGLPHPKIQIFPYGTTTSSGFCQRYSTESRQKFRSDWPFAQVKRWAKVDIYY